MSFLRGFIEQFAKIYPTAKRYLHSFHGGVFPQYNKELSANQPIQLQVIPEKLVLPLQQQIGLPADVLVNVGDYVKKNQLLAKSSKDPKKALTVPVHAPTSGFIEAIHPVTLAHPSGLQDMAIILKPDGKNITLENTLNVSKRPIETPEELKEILFNAGIVGMGGAGFPTYAKIPNQPGKIHTLLINGAECEPFITCDDLLMQTHAEEIIQGALMTAKALGSSKVICGIESNKPSAIKAMRKAALGTMIEIRVVETVYPMGGQKQLTLELTGIEIPKKAHGVDVGILMMNVATFTAIYRAVMFGEPLTSRMVTVSGLGLHKPYNTVAMIGTSFLDLAQAAQPKVEINYPLIMGGPMMGFKVKENTVPIGKTTNCVLVNPPEPIEMQMPCIRCGECMDACPIKLLPQQMYFHAQAHEFDKVEKLNVFDCIECGCCSFVCPSHIPLVQYYRHAKSEIKEMHAEQQAIELAKERHDFRNARIEREKAEREARLKAKKEAVKKQSAAKATSSDDVDNTKKPASSPAAAAARAAAAKRAAKAKKEGSTTADNAVPSARKRAIEAAQKATQQASQKAEQPNSEQGNEPAIDPKVAARNAAIQAAKKRAQAKAAYKAENADTQTEMESLSNTVDKKDPKQAAKEAAMRAAQRRAQAKKETADTPEPETTPDSVDTSTVSLTVDLTEQTADTDASRKETARKKAKEAAQLAAKRRADKARQAEKIEKEETKKNLPDEVSETDPATEKRNRAVEAARQRAAQRKAQQDQKNDE